MVNFYIKKRNYHSDELISMINEKNNNPNQIKVPDNVTKVVDLLKLRHVDVSFNRTNTKIKGRSDITGEIMSVVLEHNILKESFESPRDEVRRLYNEGLPQDKIAKYVGVSQKTISNMINDFRTMELKTRYENTFISKNDRIGIEALLLSIGKKITKKNVEKLAELMADFWRNSNGEGTVASIRGYLHSIKYDDILA
ncbi:hypothetical protein AB7Y92_20620 [Providencia manganoxydans]|uniref:hypothetical protein n=1 Tax=Providencia manganoxydans TaxID=2923283 RepID=UPI0034E47FE6